MTRKNTILRLAWLACFFTGAVWGVNLTDLKGPYLGQVLPGPEPQLFAPEILSRSKPAWAFCGIFSPDQREFYFSSFDSGKNVDQIMWMRRIDDTWTQPVPALFNSAENTNDSRLSPDGNTMFFRSQRPLPGSDEPEKGFYTWYVTRSGGDWGTPRPLLLGGLPRQTGYLGVAQNGTLYFGFRSEAGNGDLDIHISKYQDGSYTIPMNLGPEVNSRYSEGDLFVAPDESYLIFTVWSHPESSGESDLYLSTRDNDGTWSKAENMGAPINTLANEGCPSVSPDNDFFFYFKVDQNGETPRGSTYWVDFGTVGTIR